MVCVGQLEVPESNPYGFDSPLQLVPRLQNYQAKLNRAQSTFKNKQKAFSDSPCSLLAMV